MDSVSRQQLLKRIATLVAENKELKRKYKALSDKLEHLTMPDIVMSKDSSDLSGRQRYDCVTVLYADVRGLSSLIKDSTEAVAYMDRLDQYFMRFNEILRKYNLTKVQSIGDSFICVGGLPDKDGTHAVRVTLAALEMLHVITSDAQQAWEVNIAIHTGAVVATVQGHEKPTYRLKGDTVNIVSRMVSIGQRCDITLTASTYELVKELFDCSYLGDLPVKYQNRLELYVVNGIRDEYAAGAGRHYPNEHFRTRFMLMQFGDMQERVLDMLQLQLPANLYYHNVKHTVDVVTESELIGWAEGLDDHQLLLLKTAALYHDTGHIFTYEGHEERSAVIAREQLPGYGYSAGEIDEICEIILATKLPPKPADLSQRIICDADLDYLGRTDFIPVSNTLFEELKSRGAQMNINDWNKMQLKFISGHQYFTETGRALREVNKQAQIERIKMEIEE